MSSVVTRSRLRSGSFTAKLLTIASIVANTVTVTGWPVSTRIQDMTAAASIVDAIATAARRSRSSPGSSPVRVVRSSASLACHHTLIRKAYAEMLGMSRTCGQRVVSQRYDVRAARR